MRVNDVDKVPAETTEHERTAHDLVMVGVALTAIVVAAVLLVVG